MGWTNSIKKNIIAIGKSIALRPLIKSGRAIARKAVLYIGVGTGGEFLSDAPFSNLVSAQKLTKQTAHAWVGGVVPMNP